MAAQLVDPHGHLEAERGGHRVLAVRAAGEQVVLGALGQVGKRRQDGRELAQEDVVGPAHLEELAGLRDVLGGRAPVHVAAGVALAGAIERPDQRHQRMPGAGQSFSHGSQIEARQVRLADDLAGGGLGDDAQLGLGPRQGRFDVEPGLEARRLGEERPHARVVDPQGGRFLLHGSDLSHGAPGLSTPSRRRRRGAV